MIYYKMRYRIKVLCGLPTHRRRSVTLPIARSKKSFIMNKWEIIDHTFKFRVGDSDEKGGCTFDEGEWKDVTTNELLKVKK